MLPENLMNLEYIATFSGLVVATGLITQATKSIVKSKFDDYIVRLYTILVAIILTFTFALEGTDTQNIVLTLINSLIVALTSMSGYEILSDPRAEKSKFK